MLVLLLFDLDSGGGDPVDPGDPGNPGDPDPNPDDPVNPGDWFMFQSPSSYSFLTSGLSTAIRGNLTDNAPENMDSVAYSLFYMTCEGGW